MKTRSVRNPILAVMLSALSVVISVIIAISVITAPRRATVAEAEDTSHGYYYSQLKNSKLAERLYNALLDMNEEGLFEECTEEYDLTSVLTQSELGDYIINKSPAIPVALGAARDAFYLDHPELFYVDVHKMRLTFSSDGNTHVAYLGAGREDNYYADYTADSKAAVKAAVADFDAQVTKVVTAAKAKTDVVEQIKYVNEYLCDNAKYDFGAYDDAHSNKPYNGYVYTAYGILNGTEGKALCEGYAKAFKVIMDKLGIPCVLIAGAACNGIDGVDSDGNTAESTYEPHMWNAVQVEGQWYGVDVTWNDTENNHNKYMLLGELSLMKSRYDNPVISSSEFKVRYPVLRVLDYGDFTDDGGFEFKDSGTVGGQELGPEASGLVGVSYEDKNINQLRADGKYLAVRLGDDKPWVDYTAFIDFLADNTEGEIVVGKYTLFMPYMAEVYSQFAIIDIAPNDTTDLGLLSASTWANLDDEHILAVSAKYNNQDFGIAKGMPHIKTMRPNEKGYVMSYDPTDISITYDEKLIYEDTTSTEVDIEVTAERKDIKPKVENVKWNAETNTVTFTFTPSSPYAHNSLTYNFVPTNLIGSETGERPEAGKLAFKRDEVICPKVFNDGRLYMKIYGTPEFVSADDQSLNQFKDKNGQPIVNQRSQLMLVINHPTKAENEQMEKAAEKLGDKVLASSTYQINLQMCGQIQKVPDGSYMQVGFGFPEGMGPEDEGVSFTVYHYTRNDDGTIKDVEPVPCVVTQYGVIATVKSFSPFMICAVSSDSPSVKDQGKMILASVDGIGGNIDKKDIMSVGNGGSITYTITEDEGYTLDRVLVNGVEKKDSVVSGKLTLTEAELKANNNVVVTFISDRATKFRKDNNLEKIYEYDLIVTDKDMIVAYVAGDPTPTAPEKGANVGLIVGIVVTVVVLAAAAAVALFLIFRKKNGQKATATNKNKTVKAKTTAKKEAAATKPAAKPEPTKTDKTVTANTATANRTAPTARPTTTARPSSTPTRPQSGTSQRPNSAGQRPTSATPQRPTTPPTRPQSGASSQRPSASTQRPSSTPTRPAAQRPSTGATRPAPTDKNKK
ncbi:MAG: hypothetical protein K2I75_06665 [Clostridiales bacterium]|nr:hypothetical protein [Clostridiales bacterium]